MPLIWPVMFPMSCHDVPAKLPLICPRDVSMRSNSPSHRPPLQSELQRHRPATEASEDRSEPLPSVGRRRDFAGERGSATPSPPDTDLSCFPITPPVDPACAKATWDWAATKSDNSKAKPVSRPTLYFTGNPPFPTAPRSRAARRRRKQRRRRGTPCPSCGSPTARSPWPSACRHGQRSPSWTPSRQTRRIPSRRN